MSFALTVGMAVTQDWRGLWGTLVCIREVNRFTGQIVVVNNRPDTPEGESIANICAEWGADHHVYTKAQGTSGPRDEIFRHATGKMTLVMDAHVYVPALAQIEKIIKNGQLCGTEDDLYHGPIFFGPQHYRHGGVGGVATHFRDSWGKDHMWGEWAHAWQSYEGGPLFDVWNVNGRCELRTVAMDPQIVSIKGLEDIRYDNHQSQLLRAGCIGMGTRPGQKPFEIPGMGMGMFLAATKSWLGFHPLATGFGGEEMTIHEYYRDHGRKVWCVPDWGWHHRFTAEKTDPGYKLIDQQRARNYVLSIGRLKNRDKHWPKLEAEMRSWIGNEWWDKIVADPEKECSTCGAPQQIGPSPFEKMTPEDALSFVRSQKRDIDQQVDNLLRAFAGMDEITLVVKRREWEIVALAAGGRVTTHNQETQEPLRKKLAEWYGEKLVVRPPAWPAAIEETDCLCLDTEEFGQRLYGELKAYGPMVRKRIIVHATNQPYDQAPGNRPGLLVGLREWLRENPEWTVVLHSPEQYGLTVISKEPTAKQELPTTLTMVWNFAAAMAKHVSAGAKTATPELVQIRLGTCDGCSMRADDRCTACGCWLQEKATLQTSECPLGFWEEAERAESPITPAVNRLP